MNTRQEERQPVRFDQPRLRLIDGARGSDFDPWRGELGVWNREWTPGEHGGPTFITETAHVDVVNRQSGFYRLRIFVGGSRTITDRAVVESRIKALPCSAIVLTSRTHGTSAAIRDSARQRGLHLEVWTAMSDRYLTATDAYFARDEEMIRTADQVIAFWDGRSTGTAHELAYARKLARPIELVLVNPDTSLDPFPGGEAA
jgi:hypothetical protein